MACISRGMLLTQQPFSDHVAQCSHKCRRSGSSGNNVDNRRRHFPLAATIHYCGSSPSTLAAGRRKQQLLPHGFGLTEIRTSSCSENVAQFNAAPRSHPAAAAAPSSLPAAAAASCFTGDHCYGMASCGDGRGAAFDTEDGSVEELGYEEHELNHGMAHKPWWQTTCLSSLLSHALLFALCSAAAAAAFFSPCWQQAGSGRQQLLWVPHATAATAKLPLPSTSQQRAAATSATSAGWKDVRKKAAYQVDQFFATEPSSKALVLAAACTLLTVVGGVAYHAAYVAAVAQKGETRGGGEDEGGEGEQLDAEEDEGEVLPLGESLWTAWMFVSNPGQHAGEEGFFRRLVGLVVSIGGMLFFALLVGLAADGVAGRVDRLNKGLSPVLEADHTLVMGWTPRTVGVVKALISGDKSRSIVVLGGEEKEAMDEELRSAIPLEERGGAKVVTRKGSAMALDDLHLVSAAAAKSILVLKPPSLPANTADIHVMRSCLALASLPDLSADIIAEVSSLDNLDILTSTFARQSPQPLLQPLGTDSKPSNQVPVSLLPDKTSSSSFASPLRVVFVAVEELSLRMILNLAIAPEAAAVASELISFHGCEFHLKEWPELTGTTFGEALFMFSDAIPVGLRRQKTEPDPGSAQKKTNLPGTGRKSFQTLINPPRSTVLQPGDKLLVVAKEVDSYRPGPTHQARASGWDQASSRGSATATVAARQDVLICGWRDDVGNAVKLLDAKLGRGSSITLFIPSSFASAATAILQPLTKNLQNVSLNLHFGQLNLKGFEELPVEKFDRVVVLSAEGASNNLPASGQSSHAQSTATMAMFIRNLQIERGRKDAIIVAEVTNAKGDVGEAVAKRWINHSVNSNNLEALLLAQVVQDSDVGSVLDDFASDSGHGLAVRNAMDFTSKGESLSFWDLQERVAQNDELLLALKSSRNGSKWELNPINKDEKASTYEDKLVVVSSSNHAQPRTPKRRSFPLKFLFFWSKF